MNPDWQNFLTQRGATIAEGVVQRFGDNAAELGATARGTVLCDLGQFGTLRVSGIDAQPFLQNLLSNDIREVSTSRAQLSSLNTAKGRMLASLLIWRDGEDYLLQLPRMLCEPIRKKLSMYVLRAKVKISDASDEIISLGLSGANAQDVLRGLFGELPQDRFAITHPSTGSAPKVRDPLSDKSDAESSVRTEILIDSVIRISDTRFQINASAPHASALWLALSQHAQPVGSDCWDWLNIRAGIPIILPQTQEQFVAQMVNFDLIGGVNFKKGCYPGQEIVARMQYLGKLKRRMYLAHINFQEHRDSTDAPQAGDELFSADDENQLSRHRMEGQACGMIVNAAPAPGGGYDVLATVQIASRDTQAIHWKSLQGEALQFLPLPYPLPQS